MKRAWFRTVAGTVLITAVLAASGVAQAGATVAAASNLRFALESLAERFEAESGHRVRITFGASGHMARQIARDAPFELLLSADIRHVRFLVERGITLDDGMPYAEGRLVLYAPRSSPVDPREGLEGLATALAEGRLKRLVIAHPEHAPYGRAAREALESAGLWEAVQDRLITAESAGQAARFATARAVEVGLIPLSLAQAPALSKRGRWSAIPDSQHTPIKHHMVLTRDAGPVAHAFYGFLQGESARGILRSHGFTVAQPQ